MRWQQVKDSVGLRWTLVGLACVGLVAIGLAAGCSGGDGDGTGRRVLRATLTPIASGFVRPNYVTSANDGTGRLFVVEQRGTIRIIESSGRVVPEPFLDISGEVNDTGESGLLSVAFHPNYRNNGRFFVYFCSDRDGPIRSYLAEFQVAALNPNRANEASERVLFEVDQGSFFHNGGLVTFGPEGYLWCSLGDGGNPTRQSAQDRSNLLGTLVRIDVDRSAPYSIPDDNPFAGRAGIRGEIYAWGFRNPWRYSIDPATGRIFVGDVGQDDWEEINLVKAGGNYGWPIMEGAHCFPPGTTCDQTGLELPIYEYPHGQGGVCSITGGYVYRGARYPQLRGAYFYADYCAGTIYRLTEDTGQWQSEMELDTELRITSFGVDANGEMYVVDLDGGVHRMDFAPQTPA